VSKTGKNAVGVELVADVMDGDGKVDLETKVHVVVEAVSPFMSNQVSNHIVIPALKLAENAKEAAKESAEKTIEAAKATFESLQNAAEKGMDEVRNGLMSKLKKKINDIY
jgi:hypothetical protein